MAGPNLWGLIVKLSESFSQSIRALADELELHLVERPAGDSSPTGEGCAACLVLAGGAEPEGLDWLARFGGHPFPTYLVGAAPDHRMALAAVARGARDYFALPGDLDLLRRTVERVLREARAADAVQGYAADERRANGFGAMIGTSPAILQTIANARRVAALRDVTVLIGGETGTGKELLARAIHYESPRAKAPFVEINCAAIPVNLLESELFGHERGAFTGAVAAKPGLFELADGGTIFLDEIGNLPLELQPKLLRAIESHEIRRVGGTQTRKIDVRVVGATHVELGRAVANGSFREDLYYRLNVVHLSLPPLRDRGADIELLAEACLRRLAAQYQLPVPPLGAEARSALRAHSWPGNVRELRNAVERALVLSPPGKLDLGVLGGPRLAAESAPGLPFPASLGQIIRAAALSMLDRVGGNKSEAARRLGISRPRLQRILEGHTDEP